MLLSLALAFRALLATASEPVVLKGNGGWCWFQDERAIIVGDRLIFGSVVAANAAGSERGDIEVTSLNLNSRARASFKLHRRLQSDDHNVPAFLALPNGRILATYQTHGGRKEIGPDLMRWRRTLRPADITEWTEEKTLPVGAAVSYSNPFRVAGENGRIYLFHRGVGFNPNYLISEDNGETFKYGGRLLAWPRPVGNPGYTGTDGGRPYLKYAQHGDDIHIVATEDHPRAFDNSIYHAFIRGSKWRSSDGGELAPLSQTRESLLKPTDLTRVFQGDPDHVAWMCDFYVDSQGRPRVLFSVQRGGAAYRGGKGGDEKDGQDHRYCYARWDGQKWTANEIARAGRRLYPGEDDYTGLGAIDPQDPTTVIISTDADPVCGAPLISKADGRRHWEIFQGRSADGNNWQWTPITSNSSADNLRPIIPIWPDANGNRIVLWLRGAFRSYTDYDLDVVALLP